MRSRRSFGRMLLLIVFLALVLRVAYVAGAKKGPCEIATGPLDPDRCAVGDQTFYNGEANRLAHGRRVRRVGHPRQRTRRRRPITRR